MTPAPSPSPTPVFATPTFLAMPIPRIARTPAPTHPPTPTPSAAAGSIEGRVIRQGTQDGIVGALVRLIPLVGAEGASGPGASGPSPRARETVSGRDGGFALDALEPGVYRVEARKDGLALLPARDGETPRLALQPGEKKTDLSVSLYPGHTVRGVVKDRQNGEPLEWVKVSALDDDGLVVANGVTGADGAFALEGVRRPRVELRAEKTGYALVSRRQRPARIVLGPEALDVKRDLQMAPAVAVSGTARMADGAAAAGATVSVLYPAGVEGLSRSVVAGDDGAFQLGVTPGTSIRLEARAPGRAPAFSAVLDVGAPALSGIEMIFLAEAAVSGKVVDSNGRPVAGASVVVEDDLCLGFTTRRVTLGQTTTDRHGEYRLGFLPPRPLRLVASAPGLAASAPVRADLLAGETRALPPVGLRAPLAVAGVVLDAGGNPVAGSRVEAQADTPTGEPLGEVWSGVDGGFRLTALSPGPVNFTLSHPDHGRARAYGIASGREDLGLSLNAGRAYTLRGRVVDWKTGEAVSDFTVSCNAPDTAPNADTGEAGVFLIENIPADRVYSVWISAADYPPHSFPVRPGAARVWAPSSTSAGETGSPGTSEADGSAGSASGESRSSGSPGSSSSVPPVGATGASDSDPSAGEAGQAGDAGIQESVFVVGPGASIAGQVVDAASGKPIAGVRVLNFGEGQPVASTGARGVLGTIFTDPADAVEPRPLNETATDAQGRFRLDGVQPPRAHLFLRPAPNRPPQAARVIEGLAQGKETEAVLQVAW